MHAVYTDFKLDTDTSSMSSWYTSLALCHGRSQSALHLCSGRPIYTQPASILELTVQVMLRPPLFSHKGLSMAWETPNS